MEHLLGMYPKIDECPLEEEVVKKSNAVFDAIYNPSETKLLYYARKNNVKHIGGLSMLVWQAAAAEEIWNDVKYTKEDIDRVIEVVRREILK